MTRVDNMRSYFPWCMFSLSFSSLVHHFFSCFCNNKNIIQMQSIEKSHWKKKVPYQTIWFQNSKPLIRFRKNLRHLQNDCQRSRKLFKRFRRFSTKPKKGFDFWNQFETFLGFVLATKLFLSFVASTKLRVVPFFFSVL